MGWSTLFILGGGVLAAIGAALLGVCGVGLIGALELLTWNVGQSTSLAAGQVSPAFLGGALCLLGLAVAQIGVYQVSSSAIVSLPARFAFLAVGMFLVAGGALIVNSVGGAFAQLQVIAMSENAPQAAEVHETIRLLNVNLNLGGWLLLGAPLVVMGAMLLGADPTRKPGPMPLAPLFPLIGVWLAAALGVFAFAWSWIQVGDAEAMLRERMPQPQKLVASLDALLFGAFLLGATFVLVALPAAMSALAMASDAEPAADQTTDAK